MDWGNVTADELFSSLQEVDWSQPPRRPTEFLGKFSVPSTQRKLGTRLKCNTYTYRSNYLLILMAALGVAFLRKPWALLAVLLGLLGTLCLNNTFAISLSNNILKLIRRIHTPTAQRLRSISGGHSGLGAPGRTKMEVKLIGVPRPLFVAVVDGLSLFLLFRRGALLTLAMSLLIGTAIVLLHASFRVPNLKTRLASAREDFRNIWKGYQAGPEHDYTL